MFDECCDGVHSLVLKFECEQSFADFFGRVVIGISFEPYFAGAGCLFVAFDQNKVVEGGVFIDDHVQGGGVLLMFACKALAGPVADDIGASFEEAVGILAFLIEYKAMRVMFDHGDFKAFSYEPWNQLFDESCFA